MVKVSLLSMLMVTLLAGCGQVVVFGHVVGEKPAPVAPAADSAAPASAMVSASAAESGSATTSASASKRATVSAPASESATAPASATPPVRDVATSTASLPAEQRLPSNAPLLTHPVKAINLTITAEAAAKITSDASRFTADALLNALRTELKSRQLLDEQNPQASGTAEIIVDDLATRSTSNAILFGYKMLAGTLEGDIRVTGAEHTESTGSRIVAESKLTIAANGEDKNLLGPLYRRFAVLAADRLAGVTSKPPDPTGIPRF